MGRRGHLRAVVVVALLLVVPAASARDGFSASRLDRELRGEPGVLAVLVERNDHVIFERYYRGSAVAARLDIFSITKSVTATLVGIALRDQNLQGLDEPLANFFPVEVRAAPDRRVRKITLRQLLTMTAGYAGTPAIRTDQWVQTLIRRPLANDPGYAFAYDDGSYHLLSAVLTKATRMTADAYAQRMLLGPLGIRDEHWESDGEGNSRGDTGLRLRARDLLRFGELYLHGGLRHGRRIAPAAYVRAATRAHTSVDNGIGYGYGWWAVSNRRPRGFAALGAGGQAVVVLPALNAVVVIQGGGEDRDKVLYRLVLPELGIR